MFKTKVAYKNVRYLLICIVVVAFTKGPVECTYQPVAELLQKVIKDLFTKKYKQH